MNLSGHIQIVCIVTAIIHGAVNGSVPVQIGGGNVFAANIVEEAIHDLALPAGDHLTVVVTASDILIVN